MLLVPIVVLVAPTDAMVQPLQGGASSDSCWVQSVAPGVHVAVFGPIGCPLMVIGRDNRSDNSHLPYCPLRNDGNCRCGDSCFGGDNRPLGDSRRLGGSRLSDGSRNRNGCHRRACSIRRGSNRPPNRGCHLYICRGDGASRDL